MRCLRAKRFSSAKTNGANSSKAFWSPSLHAWSNRVSSCRGRVDIERQNATDKRKQQVCILRGILNTMIVVLRFSRLYRTRSLMNFARTALQIRKGEKQCDNN